jgi:hypothetical protein
MNNRAETLMKIAFRTAATYHEDMFSPETQEKYPNILTQVINNEAFEMFCIEDLSEIEINYIKRQIELCLN